MTDIPEKDERPEDLLHVALCREADDLRRMHPLIGAKPGLDPWMYWDCSGTRSRPTPVAALLGICGFAGSPPPAPEVTALDEKGVTSVPVLGFTVPVVQYAAVRTAIQTVMSGRVGGFVPLVVAQAGFHDAVIDVFSYIWTQAGGPPIWVRTPDFQLRGSGTSVPESLLPYAGQVMSYGNSAYIRGNRGPR